MERVVLGDMLRLHNVTLRQQLPAGAHLRDAGGAGVQCAHSPRDRQPQHVHILLVAGDEHPDPVLRVFLRHEGRGRPVHLREGRRLVL
jgi:hypothetical protein